MDKGDVDVDELDTLVVVEKMRGKRGQHRHANIVHHVEKEGDEG